MPLAMLTIAGVLLETAIGSPPPPKPAPRPEPLLPMTHVRLQEVGTVEWDMDENIARGKQLPAVDVEGLRPFGWHYEPPQREEGAAQPDGPSRAPFHLYAKEGKQVVDATVFSNLRLVSARDAKTMDARGVVVGRIKSKEFDPADLAQFLVVTGIVDANLHVVASVRGSVSKGTDGSHWCRLSSSDHFWTNGKNHISYDFGIEIAPDGTIRVYNPKYHGRRIVVQN